MIAMRDAIGEDLEPGDYVVVCLSDWVNNMHLGKVIGGGSKMISVSLSIYGCPEEKRLVQVNCVAKVSREAAVRFMLSK